jgi:release factor glutamine methyltransferase
VSATIERAPVPELLREGRRRLDASGLPTARQDAEWLLAEVLGVARFALYTAPPPVTPDAAARYAALVARRAAHEPLQHLLGWEEFRGLRLGITPDVLVPRPETEGLVDFALARLAGARRIADVGTGSGAIACALATALPEALVLAVDCAAPVLAVARGNVAALGLEGRVRVVAGDLLEPLAGEAPLDGVVANLPYLPSGLIASLPREVAAFEPHGALDGGPDGLALVARLVAEAPGLLAAGGWLVLEVGDDQAERVTGLVAAAGLTEVTVGKDLNGIGRYVAGRR